MVRSLSFVFLEPRFSNFKFILQVSFNSNQKRLLLSDAQQFFLITRQSLDETFQFEGAFTQTANNLGQLPKQKLLGSSESRSVYLQVKLPEQSVVE